MERDEAYEFDEVERRIRAAGFTESADAWRDVGESMRVNEVMRAEPESELTEKQQAALDVLAADLEASGIPCSKLSDLLDPEVQQAMDRANEAIERSVTTP